MARLQVLEKLCQPCGKCAQVCPLLLFVQEGDAVATLVEPAEKLCIECGHCVSVCPHGAIQLNGEDGSNWMPVESESIAPGDLDKLMRARRSVRNYQPEALEDTLVEELIDATRWAPTVRNSQTLSWHIVEGKERLRALSDQIARILQDADTPGGYKFASQESKDLILRDAPHVLIVTAPAGVLSTIVDSTLALHSLDLAACARGLGCCWAGLLMMASNLDPTLARDLGIPEDQKILGAMMLGRPAVKYAHVPPRKAARIRRVH